jgi:hypothetical protein
MAVEGTPERRTHIEKAGNHAQFFTVRNVENGSNNHLLNVSERETLQ